MASANGIRFGSPDSALMQLVASGGGATITSTDLGTQYNGIAFSTVLVMGDTITAIGYHQGTTTGTPAANSYSIAIFPTTTGGAPNTGATFANAALNSVTVTSFTPSSANDNKWVWVSLGANTYNLNQAQEISIVLWRNAATDASNKITANPSFDGRVGYSASYTASAGTWTKNTTATGTMGLQSASTCYGRPWTGSAFTTNNTIGGTTESGMSFTIPTNFCSTAKLRGFSVFASNPATSTTDTWVGTLYSSPASSPARLDQTAGLVADRFTSSNATFRRIDFYFTSSTALTAGTKYAIAFATTSSSVIYTMAVETASDFNAWDFQQQAAFTTRTASSYAAILAGTATGNFSDTATKRPFIDLIFDDLTAPAGSAGMLFIPDLAGT